MISVWGSSIASWAGGGERVCVSSCNEERHMNPAQVLPQARTQGWLRSSTSATAEDWQEGEAEQAANSGWMVQQFTPTLCSTFVTPDIRSAHLWTKCCCNLDTSLTLTAKYITTLIYKYNNNISKLNSRQNRKQMFFLFKNVPYIIQGLYTLNESIISS